MENEVNNLRFSSCYKYFKYILMLLMFRLENQADYIGKFPKI